ncbi:MAG: HlyD family secretion protein, partial [Deltaproteobacteria bacterium]
LPPENATGNYIKVVQRVPVKITFDATEELDRVLLAPGLSVVPEVDISAEGSRVEKKKGADSSQ